MGLRTLVERQYVAKLNPQGLRQVVLPAGAAVTATANAAGSTYGNWVDVATAATVTQDTLVVGVILTALSAPDVFTVDIGSCLGYANAAAVIAAGAAAIAAAHRAEVRYERVTVVVTAVGTYGLQGGYIPLTFPVWIPAGVGILGRCYGITAAAVTVDISAVCVQGF